MAAGRTAPSDSTVSISGIVGGTIASAVVIVAIFAVAWYKRRTLNPSPSTDRRPVEPARPVAPPPPPPPPPDMAVPEPDTVQEPDLFPWLNPKENLPPNDRY